MLLELLWRPPPPSRNNSQGKQGVSEGEHPRRCLIKQDAVDPLLDKAAKVVALPRLKSKPVFQSGEWAFDTQPAFNNHDANGQQVQCSKPPAVDPPPMHRVAHCDQQQASDDKQHDGEMNQQHRVSKK